MISAVRLWSFHFFFFFFCSRSAMLRPSVHMLPGIGWCGAGLPPFPTACWWLTHPAAITGVSVATRWNSPGGYGGQFVLLPCNNRVQSPWCQFASGASVHSLKVSQGSKQLWLSKLKTSCDVCCAYQSIFIADRWYHREKIEGFSMKWTIETGVSAIDFEDQNSGWDWQDQDVCAEDQTIAWITLFTNVFSVFICICWLTGMLQVFRFD